jgi:amidase/nitrilase
MKLEDSVKVAVAQISPEFMDKEATLDKACKTVESAGKKGAKLVVFPETFIPGYPYWRGVTGLKWANFMVEYQKNAVKVPEDVENLCETAKDSAIALIVGINEMDKIPGSVTLYNTLLFIDSNGKILGKHRKLMPTHGERMIWGMGDGTDIQTYPTEAGILGGLICYENHMTPIKTLLAVQGEEVHAAVWPGYWAAEKHTANKRRFNPEKDKLSFCDIDCAIREYAFETQTFVISANLFLPADVLPEGSFDIAAGGSAIVNPSGLYLAEPVFNEERIIFAELDPEERLATKAYFDCVGHYSRWDVVQLHFKARQRVPLKISEDFAENILSSKKIEELVKNYEIKLKRVEEIVENLIKNSEG